MKKIVVLGAGLVGSVIARDISADSDKIVTVVDRDKERLAKFSGGESLIAKEGNVLATDILDGDVMQADLVVNAVPGSIGYKVFSELAARGRDVVDIAFFAEEPTQCQQEAKKSGARVVFDSGVAPGLSNMIVGFTAEKLDSVNEVKIMVGGLPQQRD